MLLKGCTNEKGDDACNLALSRRRAEAVKNWMAANGVPVERLDARGYGEADPVAPNQHPTATTILMPALEIGAWKLSCRDRSASDRPVVTLLSGLNNAWQNRRNVEVG
ncbi:OmpA family protein [Lysobacter sp. ISL-50]|uniref:OmpA family protein n=1 Tax=unclassified Lysobacter TaxID=2635362 RepID=UPI001BE83E9D|nr:OmpA family protein [Lysobacter sp. ISL-42]MBT2751696.1 OmpA family protein [Lysobacter sp. ISL-50]MBT2775890.1 OmpA family protein [Lysobacter sp. ISL-54]MBT2782146.1 OmpA family protein [Lysobacter sp. ISL-52]